MGRAYTSYLREELNKGSMMLSQTAEYALRAAVFLGRNSSGEPIPSERIADGLGAPLNYLSNTLHELARRGVVIGVRGPHGGFRLAVPPEELTLYELIGHFDQLNKRDMCLLGARPCDASTPCAAHDRWERVAARMAEPLRSTTLADLLPEGAELSALGLASESGPTVVSRKDDPAAPAGNDT
jgi:Rrf2 family protein